MKIRNMEERLALVGAMIVLIGVSFAAEDALAEQNATVTTTAVAIHKAAANTLEIAREANKQAAASANESLQLTNWIDLDIRLEDRSSTLVAGKQK